MAQGSESIITRAADAVPQDVLLTAHAAETENSNVSYDANIKGHEDSNPDADNKSDESAVISSNTPVDCMEE